MYTMTEHEQPPASNPNHVRESRPILVGNSGVGRTVSANFESPQPETIKMPSFHAFSTINNEVNAEDISTTYKSQTATGLGVTAGVLAGLFMCRYWSILIVVLILFLIMTASLPLVTDSFVTGVLWLIHSSYTNLRNNIRMDKNRPHVN